MDIDYETRQIADSADETIRAKLLEYLVLREELKELTGAEDPSEATLLDILPIADADRQRRAGATAARMRRLARQTFPLL